MYETKAEAERVIEGMRGWDDIAIVHIDPCAYTDEGFEIVATDPVTRQRMVYIEATGYFESLG